MSRQHLKSLYFGFYGGQKADFYAGISAIRVGECSISAFPGQPAVDRFTIRLERYFLTNYLKPALRVTCQPVHGIACPLLAYPENQHLIFEVP